MNSEIGNYCFIVHVNKVINEILIASAQDDRNLVSVRINCKCSNYLIISWYMIKHFEKCMYEFAMYF